MSYRRCPFSKIKTLPIREQMARARELAFKKPAVAASELEITRTYLSSIENGKRQPSLALLLKMAETYGYIFKIGPTNGKQSDSIHAY
jgi:transcriptional regulator with XRE-family HTH domain